MSLLHHRGKYTGEDFTIEEVINSLSAQKELIEAGLDFLCEIDPKLKVEALKIRVASISTSSLAWDLLIEVYGKYQETIDVVVIDGLEEMLNADIPPQLEGIITLAMLAVTYMVARYAYDRIFAAKNAGQPAIHIHGENNIVIQQVAAAIGSDQEHIVRALERSLPAPKKRSLVKKVADFLRPAKKAPGQSIELEGAPSISSDALGEFPNDAELASLDDGRNIDLPNALIDIRRLDRDKGSTGWAAVILNDERFPKRLPMDLYPTVDPAKLAEFQTVKADLIVECDSSPNGDGRPRRIHLLSFQPDGGNQKDDIEGPG